MKKQKNNGITLIALVITIIVLLILAGVSIATLTGENSLLGKTSEVKFKNDVKQYEEELKLSIYSEIIDGLGNRTNSINVLKKDEFTGEENQNYEAEMKKYIPSFDNNKYGDKLEIRNDGLIYTGEENLKEREWFVEVKLTLDKIFAIVNYVDEEGNKLADTEKIETENGKYEIEPKGIEGYEPEKLLYEGMTTKDTEINITYIPESKGLVFIGLDSEENETEDESKIVAYKVAGIGELKGTDLVIPREHNGKPVTQIKRYAFQNNKTLNKVTIPESIQKVGGYVFSGSKVKSLIINAEEFPTSWCSLAGMKNLEEAIIGKNVKSLGGQVFAGDSKLEKIKIYSDSIESINGYSFDNCSALKEIEVNDNNTGYKVVDNVLYSKDGKKLIFYPAGKTDEDFKVLSETEEIGKNACYQNNFLKTVKIPNTIKKIGGAAFQYCNNMQYLYLNAERIEGAYTFQSSSLAKVDIGENVSFIDGAALAKCTNLTEVTIYSEEVDINGYQFSGCTSLEQFKLKEGHAKYTAIDGVLYSKTEKILYACPSGKKGELIIPDGVETVTGGALQSSYPNMTKLEIPKTVKTIEFNVFKPLTNIDYKGTIEEWSGVKVTFKNGTTVKTVTCTDGTVNL